jgi:hypothetical protein
VEIDGGRHSEVAKVEMGPYILCGGNIIPDGLGKPDHFRVPGIGSISQDAIFSFNPLTEANHETFQVWVVFIGVLLGLGPARDRHCG